MTTRMLQRRGLASEWAATNPILDAGEIGFELDTGRIKIGNGTTHWNDISDPYLSTDPDLVALASLDSTTAGAIASDGAGWIKKTYAQFKASLGLAKADVGLGNVDNTADVNKPVSTAQAAALAAKADLVGGVIPTSQLPAIATGQTVTVASQAAMLALTAVQVQPGDIAIRSDQSGRRWLLSALDPSILANWIQLETPDAVTSVNGQAGAVVLSAANVGAQPSDPDLTSIAALDSTTAGAIGSDGAGWIKKTYAQVKTSLALVKADVGLGNVDNTSDVNKPVSTAQSAALVAKAGSTMTGELVVPDLSVVGLTGATAASRYVGGTVSGPPTSGTFAKGDFVIDQTAKIQICTAAGTPGTWAQAGGSGGSSTLVVKSISNVYGGGIQSVASGSPVNTTSWSGTSGVLSITCGPSGIIKLEYLFNGFFAGSGGTSLYVTAAQNTFDAAQAASSTISGGGVFGVYAPTTVAGQPISGSGIRVITGLVSGSNYSFSVYLCVAAGGSGVYWSNSSYTPYCSTQLSATTY